MPSKIWQERLACRPLGLQLYWQGPRLLRLELFFCKQSLSRAGLSLQGTRILNFLQGYLNGQALGPPRITLAWEVVSEFQSRVLSGLQAAVNNGQQISYQGLAELCGRPNSARAVGRVMARNPWPLLIPCHRVLAKGGHLGGFSSGLEIKRFLLDLEGITYKE
ncbi:MAG: MGMT family protein [Desulfohalobiaceae bacterium]